MAANHQIWKAYHHRKSQLPDQKDRHTLFTCQPGIDLTKWCPDLKLARQLAKFIHVLDINLTWIETSKALWPLAFQSCNFSMQNVMYKVYCKILRTFTNLSMEAHTSGMQEKMMPRCRSELQTSPQYPAPTWNRTLKAVLIAMGLRMTDEHVLGPWCVDQKLASSKKHLRGKWENINSNQIIMLAYFFLSCTVSSVVSIFENTPVSHVGCSKRVLQPQVSASTFLLSTRWRRKNNIKPWLVSKSRFTKYKISSIPACIMDIISIKFSSESVDSQWKNVCLQLPRHHPNYDIPTFQPPQADHFWHAGEPTPRLSSSFTGGGNRGAQSKMIQSGWTKKTRLYDWYCISICRCLFPKIVHHPGNQEHLTKFLREVSLLFF